MKVLLSLGAGVQSSTMALMAARGEIKPMPDAAIFADTGDEPPWVYEYLDWLEKQLPFPVYRVQKGNLREDIIQSVIDQQFEDEAVTPHVPALIKGKKRFAGAPFFTYSKNGKEAMLRRQCTREYKLEPLTKKIRELCGLSFRERANGVLAQVWVGISKDEASRMKPNREKWIETRWPLIEQMMSRADCLDWMRARGYRLPKKSACKMCPFHDEAYWRDIYLYHPDLWAEVVEFDHTIRRGVKGNDEWLFLHRSLKPIDEVDLDSLEDKGQLNMFEDECEGMCGV